MLNVPFEYFCEPHLERVYNKCSIKTIQIVELFSNLSYVALRPISCYIHYITHHVLCYIHYKDTSCVISHQMLQFNIHISLNIRILSVRILSCMSVYFVWAYISRNLTIHICLLLTAGLFYKFLRHAWANHFEAWAIWLLWRSSSKNGEIIKFNRQVDYCQPVLEDTKQWIPVGLWSSTGDNNKWF